MQHVGELLAEGDAREGARAYAAHGEGADAVGTAGIEGLAIGGLGGVTIIINEARIDVTHQLRLTVEVPRLGEVGLEAQEL